MGARIRPLEEQFSHQSSRLTVAVRGPRGVNETLSEKPLQRDPFLRDCGYWVISRLQCSLPGSRVMFYRIHDIIEWPYNSYSLARLGRQGWGRFQPIKRGLTRPFVSYFLPLANEAEAKPTAYPK